MNALLAPPVRPGPVENGNYPEQLTLHAISMGAEPRLHGYALVADLIPHYSAAECALLAYCGELPTPPQVAVFEIAQAHMRLPFAVSADLHAAILAQICGARPAAVVSMAVTSAAEECERRLQAYASMLSEFAKGNWQACAADEPTSLGEAAAAQSLHAALKSSESAFAELPALGCFALWLRAMTWVGIRQPMFLAALWAQARLPAVLAEAAAVKPASFADYPMNQPPIDFVAERR